jgi:hypothetical protein
MIIVNLVAFPLVKITNIILEIINKDNKKMLLNNYSINTISISFNPKIHLQILMFINLEELNKYNNIIHRSKTSYILKKIAFYHRISIMTLLSKTKVIFYYNFDRILLCILWCNIQKIKYSTRTFTTMLELLKSIIVSSLFDSL